MNQVKDVKSKKMEDHENVRAMAAKCFTGALPYGQHTMKLTTKNKLVKLWELVTKRMVKLDK